MSWNELDFIAREYITDLENQYPDYRTRFAGQNWIDEVKLRTPKQKINIESIISSVEPFLLLIARSLLRGRYEIIKDIVVSLKGCPVDEKDLVAVGRQTIFERMSRYEPKYAISSWVSMCAPNAMVRFGCVNWGLIRIPGLYTNPKRLSLREKTKIASYKEDNEGERFERLNLLNLVIFGYQDLLADIEDNGILITDGDNGSNDISNTLESCLADEDGMSQEDIVLDPERINEIRLILATLTPREEYIIRERFGFNKEEKTLEDIGSDLNLSRERIRQIQNKALLKLKKPCRLKRLKQFLD